MRHSGLADSWRKLRRANAHFNELNREISRILSSPDGVKHDAKPLADGKIISVFITSVPDLTETGVIVGDVLHNLRSALDQMVWFLVKRGASPRPKNPKLVQFPMAKSSRSFEERAHQTIPGISADQKSLIKRYQPYRRTVGGTAMRRLRNLSDRDKHRLIVPSLLAPAQVKLSFRSHGGCEITKIEPRLTDETLRLTGKALRRGTELAWVHVIPNPPGSKECAIEMSSELQTFPSIGYGRDARPVLDRIRRVVREILTGIEELL